LEVGEDLKLYQKKAGFVNPYARKRAGCEEALCYSIRGHGREKAFCKQGGHDYSIMQESSRKERKELALPLETAQGWRNP
jgi:hypothetical protein